MMVIDTKSLSHENCIQEKYFSRERY